MKVALYLPYYDYNDGSFDVSDDYYKNEGDYAKMVEQEYVKNKDIVYNSMMGAKNGSQSLVQGVDGQTYKFGGKTSQNEEKVAFSSCEGMLYDVDGSEETVDGLIEKFASQKQFLEIVEIDLDSSEEEFESEMSLWMREHKKINTYADKLGDDWVLAREPKRNLKVRFKNKADEDVVALLEDCRIMDVGSNPLSLVLFVERMTLVNE